MTKVNFGFKQVDANAKGKMVGAVFSSVAKKYDLMNDVMSMGIHRLWKRKFVSLINPKRGDKILDVAGGTGDIAFALRKKTANKNVEITISDINKEMLEEGKKNAVDNNLLPNDLIWSQADGQKLPYAKDYYNFYTIAYGIRNFTDIQKGLDEAYRVLKPGGKFYCLEFTRINQPVLKQIYDFYSFNIIPKVGGLITGDAESYQYFVESIRCFPEKEKFCSMMRKAGFKNVKFEDLTFGITTIFSGQK